MTNGMRTPVYRWLACGALVILATTACTDLTHSSSLDASDTTATYHPPRVQRTGSLIDEPLVAHVDDDASDSDGQNAANSVPQMLGGVSAIRNTRTSGAGQ